MVQTNNIIMRCRIIDYYGMIDIICLSKAKKIREEQWELSTSELFTQDGVDPEFKEIKTEAWV